MEIMETKKKPARSKSEVYSNPLEMSPRLNYFQRVDCSTTLTNPNLYVQCAICCESMRLIEYQQDHMPKHNYLCWLIGEEPFDLDNNIIVERILARVKLRFPLFVFKCPRCYDEKKSARGFISHKQFCGKSEEEKMKLMTSCDICGRIMMPASLDSHIYLNHTKDKKEENYVIPPFKKPPEKYTTPVNKAPMDVDNDDSFHIKEELVKFSYDSDDDSKDYRCPECSFSSKYETEFLSHIKENHSLETIAPSFQKDDKFKNGLPFIPFLKTAEGIFRRPKLQAKFFVPALEWTKQQRSVYFSNQSLFPQFQIELDQWQCQAEEDIREYLQAIENSVRINCNSESWFSLKLFEAKIPKEDLAFIFCGGPIFGLGWAPGKGKQYLAIAAHISLHNFHQVSAPFTGPGNIQIWSMGNLSNSRGTTLYGTKLEFIICHDEGCCWGLEWCPSGCQDNHRMGLLALATSSGSIPIYSIPLPCKSEYSEEYSPVYKPAPIVRLELGSNLKYQCTRISWSKVQPHSIVAAGFVNGLIALWDLNSQSSLLKKGRIFYPFKVFQAHHAIVSGLSFSPVCDNYLVSSGYDKTIKFWDTNDITAPHTKHRRSLATDLCWLTHWMSCAAAIDSVYSAGETTLTLNSIRDFVYEPQTFLTSVDAAALSVSSNDWLNCIATSYDNGQVNLLFGRKQPVANNDDRKKFIKVLLEPNLFDFEMNSYLPKPKKGSQSSVTDMIDCNSYEEAAARYGIDFKIDQELGYREKLKGNAANPIEIYPLIAANKISWNTNIDCFLTTAVGYQSGFVIVSKLCLVPQDQDKIENIQKI